MPTTAQCTRTYVYSHCLIVFHLGLKRSFIRIPVFFAEVTCINADVLDAQGLQIRTPQTGAKYSQRQRNFRCEFCRGLERTRRQVAVPTLARKNRAEVRETAAIYSPSLLVRFLSLSPLMVQVSYSNSESLRQLAIRMSFVGRLRG